MPIIRLIFTVGPLLFGIGFLAPLISQSMDAMSLTAPFGLSTLGFGLCIGAALGAVANLRGRWV